jgi:hypothetical protein
MRLGLSIKLDVDYGRTGAYAGMSDWADDAVRKLQKKRDDEQLQAARFVEQQKIKQARGVPLWNSLRATIRAHISELREKAGSDVIVIQSDGLNEMILQNQVDGNGQTVRVRFSPETGQLSWTHGDKSQKGWELDVNDSGGAEFVWGMGVPSPIDSISTQILNILLGI